MYAILWYVTLSTLSSVMMMWMVLTTFIPALIMASFAGVWADRINRKWLMIDVITAIIAVIMLVFFIQIPHEKKPTEEPVDYFGDIKKGFLESKKQPN
jgi:DHA3 family macrolide efflux protein-like MFS transporter